MDRIDILWLALFIFLLAYVALLAVYPDLPRPPLPDLRGE